MGLLVVGVELLVVRTEVTGGGGDGIRHYIRSFSSIFPVPGSSRDQLQSF